jgi:hypothetical protein
MCPLASGSPLSPPKQAELGIMSLMEKQTGKTETDCSETRRKKYVKAQW